MKELAKERSAFPDAGAIGIMTLTPGERPPIAGDLVTADVHIGFLDRFSGALVIYGTVGAVEETLTTDGQRAGALFGLPVLTKVNWWR